MHADVVLLEHAVAVDRGPHELVDTEADVLVRARPVGTKALVARRPGAGVVRRLEQPDSLHDRPEARGLVIVEHQRRDAEMARRLAGGIVPDVAAGLAGERRQHRPGRAAVTALED